MYKLGLSSMFISKNKDEHNLIFENPFNCFALF